MLNYEIFFFLNQTLYEKTEKEIIFENNLFSKNLEINKDG